MMKQKVYLAKSNKANPNILINVRAELSKYDVEIVEYNGGTYSNDALLECQYLIVIPCMDNVNFDGSLPEVVLGKGLYAQIDDFKDILTTDYDDDITRIGVVINDKLDIGTYDNMYVMDSDNYIDYGVAELVEGESINDYFKSQFGEVIETKTISKAEATHLTIKL